MASLCLLVGLQDPVSLSLIAQSRRRSRADQSSSGSPKIHQAPGRDDIALYWYFFQRNTEIRGASLLSTLIWMRSSMHLGRIVVPVDHLTEEDVQVLTQVSSWWSACRRGIRR